MPYSFSTYLCPSVVRTTTNSSSETKGSLSLRKASSGSQSNIAGIPGELSFDRIIDGGTCPPMTCRDFMNYLLYVEHCAETLQFFLWYKDYIRRFGDLPARDQELSPEYMRPSASLEAISQPQPIHNKPPMVTHAVQQFVNNTFATHSYKNIGVTEPPRAWTRSSQASHIFTSSEAIAPSSYSGTESLAGIDHKRITADAFEEVEMRWQPFTVQPFRDEISQVIAIYLAEGSPRQLNLSSRDRTAVIKALSVTTHPSAMKRVAKHIEDLLRFQSHPNFIHWSICNGNRPRAVFAVTMGSIWFFAGLIVAIALTLGSASRGWRALGAIGWMIGVSSVFAGLQGMCIFMYGFHNHRHLRPWELWASKGDEELGVKELSESINTATTVVTGNGYEDEPWIEQYEKRNIISKVFDRELQIEEPALRQLQDTIAMQAMALATICTVMLTTVFMVVPARNFY